MNSPEEYTLEYILLIILVIPCVLFLQSFSIYNTKLYFTILLFLYFLWMMFFKILSELNIYLLYILMVWIDLIKKMN